MKGTIAFVKETVRGKNTFYSMKVGDTWYGTGKVNPGAKGDVIEFEAEQNGDYMNAGNITKVSSAPAATESSRAASAQGGATVPTDWAKKDAMISWQAARNSANALLIAATQAGLTGAPESLEKLVTESNKLTEAFYKSTVNLGASIGSSTAPAQKLSDLPKTAEPEFEDKLPF